MLKKGIVVYALKIGKIAQLIMVLSLIASFFHEQFEAWGFPLHLYLLVAQGHTSLDMAYGTAFVMMAVILISNALVTMYARRRQREWKQ